MVLSECKTEKRNTQREHGQQMEHTRDKSIALVYNFMHF